MVLSFFYKLLVVQLCWHCIVSCLRVFAKKRNLIHMNTVLKPNSVLHSVRSSAKLGGLMCIKILRSVNTDLRSFVFFCQTSMKTAESLLKRIVRSKMRISSNSGHSTSGHSMTFFVLQDILEISALCTSKVSSTLFRQSSQTFY